MIQGLSTASLGWEEGGFKRESAKVVVGGCVNTKQIMNFFRGYEYEKREGSKWL